MCLINVLLAIPVRSDIWFIVPDGSSFIALSIFSAIVSSKGPMRVALWPFGFSGWSIRALWRALNFTLLYIEKGNPDRSHPVLNHYIIRKVRSAWKRDYDRSG